MTRRVLVGWFDAERAVLAATIAAREAGWAVHDVYTPYPVHGMDAAMGLRASRLTYVCFAGGLMGLVCAAALQYYASVVSWPLNVGGKPFNSVPAFVPVAFEVTVLFAGLSTVAALLWRARLAPRLHARALAGVTRDRFALALEGSGPHFDGEEAQRLLRRHGAVEIAWAEVRR